ncbi:MAG: acetylglutamate kinase [Candidatus Methanomethylophilaceae archaeon]|jgi:acetylglutamate kinase
MLDDVYLIKFGGNAISGKADLDRLSGEVAGLIHDGAKIVLVHGGGPEINAELEKKGITPVKVAGLRITDDATLEVAESVLKKINTDVVESLKVAGVMAVGVPGYFVTECVKKAPIIVTENGEKVTVDLQNVGDVVSVDIGTIEDLLRGGVTPVIYPIGASSDMKHLNINADTMAAGIAAGIKCREMIQITDVPGIMLDMKDPSSKQDVLTLTEVDKLIFDGVISGGMIPKVDACRNALNAGVAKVRMVNGKDPRSIVSDVMRSVEHGTIITK